MPDHPGLAQGERDEHADGVERNEVRDAALEGDDQERREDGEDHDPDAERKAVAAELELPRHEPILAQDAGQPREAGIGRVRGEDQEHGRRQLHGVVDRAPGADQRAGDLADDRLLLARVGHDPQLPSQEADAEKDGREQGAHGEEHPRAWVVSGGLKAGTPLETASVPVSATDPDANARRMRRMPSACDPWASAHPAGGT